MPYRFNPFTGNFDFTDKTQGGGGSVTQSKSIEVDFGSLPKAEESFIISDGDVTNSSEIIGCVAYKAPTGKDLDELEMDGIDVKFATIGTGQLRVYVKGLEGYLHDKFYLTYFIN